jgi:RNA polymerase sigma factor, sigma-70 family
MFNTEPELLKRALKGDGDAFGDLIRKYENFVYNTVYHAIGNRDDAFDVSQEVFIKAYRALKNFRGDCKFSTWLYKIAMNASKDYIRDKSKHRTVSLSDWTDDDISMKPPEIIEEAVTANPEESYERDEQRDAVRKAIANLSEDHRNVIVLRDIEGYSYEEIAEMLDIEVGTVKSRINRARNAVKENLKEWNIYDF